MSNLFELQNTPEFLTLLEDPNKIVVLDFHAAWCGPCKKLGQILHELVVKENKYPTVVFAKADTDKKELIVGEGGKTVETYVFSDLMSKFKVSGIPRVLIFKGMELKKDIQGCRPDLIIEALDKLLT